MPNSDALKILFPVALEGVFDQDIQIEGELLDAAQASADRLLKEFFADTTTALIADWERTVGVSSAISGASPPAPGVGDGLLGDGLLGDGGALAQQPPSVPMQARRTAILQQLQARGGLSKLYFIGLAAAMGVTITIDEFRPFMAGLGRAGDPIYVPEAVFCWRINVPGATCYYFCAGQSCAGEPLRWWLPQASLEAIFNRLKPAHTYVFFNYS